MSYYPYYLYSYPYYRYVSSHSVSLLLLKSKVLLDVQDWLLTLLHQEQQLRQLFADLALRLRLQLKTL